MSLIIELNNFEYPELPEIVDWIENRPPGSRTNIIRIVNEIKPSDIYLYLYAKFGAPNGIQNLLRGDDSDNLIHWDWTLKHRNGLLMFLGMNQRTEAMFIGSWDFELIDREQLIRSIKSDFRNMGSEMSRIRKNVLESWETFINPYHHLEGSIMMMEEELDQLKINPESDKFSNFSSLSEARKVGDKINNISSRYVRAYGISKSLQALTPVLAEAFLNLVLLLLMKKEVKDNDRLKQSVIRANIDIKVQSLGLYCTGFRKQVDWQSKACVDYNRIINSRNDILHGNIVISKLKTGEIYFNGKVPVFKEYPEMWEQIFDRKLEASGFNDVKENLKAVRGFITYVLECLEPDSKRAIEHAMSKSELGRNLDDGRFGVLLPDHIADMMTSVINEG